MKDELRQIRSEIAELKQASTLIAESVQTQTEMLSQILEAITQEAPKSELSDVLERILSTLDIQTNSLVGLVVSIDKVGPSVENAVVRGLNRAMGITDDDGVVQEDNN